VIALVSTNKNPAPRKKKVAVAGVVTVGKNCHIVTADTTTRITNKYTYVRGKIRIGMYRNGQSSVDTSAAILGSDTTEVI
jgi:hypothetical protein|tara:strand:- start:3804 stop:4043 length:240 start_codon:yes stop_codon:yes gene_type:complete